MSLGNISAKGTVPLRGKLIIIDAGHGGIDPGTVYGDIYEKTLNLKISLELKRAIENYGGSVIMIREGDYDLSSPTAMFRKKSDFDNRIKVINDSGADLYLSIHMNYLMDGSYFGPQVFYKNNDEILAEQLQKQLNTASGGNRNIKIMPSDTYMYKRINISGALIECGFLSNANEREKLNTEKYRQEIAKAITNALAIYFT